MGMKPVAIFPDPFRRAPNILVLCEAIAPKTHAPIATNTRRAAKGIFDEKLELEPWFGIEQEYTLIKKDGMRPFSLRVVAFQPHRDHTIVELVLTVPLAGLWLMPTTRLASMLV